MKNKNKLDSIFIENLTKEKTKFGCNFTKLVILIFASFLVWIALPCGDLGAQDVYKAHAVRYEKIRNADGSVIIQNIWGFAPPIYEVIDKKVVKSEFVMTPLLDYSVNYYQYIEGYGGFYVLGSNQGLPSNRQFIVPGRFASRSFNGSAVEARLRPNAKVYRLENPEIDNFVAKETPMSQDTDFHFSTADGPVLIRGFTGDFYAISSTTKGDDCFFVDVRDVILDSTYSPQGDAKVTFSNQWNFPVPINVIDKSGVPVCFGDTLESGGTLNGSFAESPELGYFFNIGNRLVVSGKFITVVNECGKPPIVVPREGARFFQSVNPHDNFLNEDTPIEQVDRQFSPEQHLRLKGISPIGFFVCAQTRFDYFNDVLIIRKDDVLNRDELEELFSIECGADLNFESSAEKNKFSSASDLEFSNKSHGESSARLSSESHSKKSQNQPLTISHRRSNSKSSGFIRKQDKNLPVGLGNSGLFCYANALVQSLFRAQTFSSEILKAGSYLENHEQYHETLLYKLYKLFFGLQQRQCGLTAATIAQSLGLVGQQDVVEFYVRLMTELEKEAVGVFAENQDVAQAIEQALKSVTLSCDMKTKFFNYGDGAHNETIEKTTTFFLGLPLNSGGTREGLGAVINRFLSPKKAKVDGGDWQGLVYQTKITGFAPVIFIQLNRFSFNMKSGSIRKLSHIVDIPKVIIIRGVKYNLISEIVHIGDALQGHYVTDVNLEGNWLKLDDSYVTKITDIVEAQNNSDFGIPYFLCYSCDSSVSFPL
ncbi:MAG: ubiquitin carboxyl-terminal hydrolase [Oscillospiraceae bacterium]|jgi:hypothetical protein|nr:ubiquitin carboxyl-terminal hydrolase [Oscillospiraceae bacterium]